MSDSEEGDAVKDSEDDLKEDEEPEPCLLTHETVAEGLSMLGRIGNGLSHAYIRLDLKNKRLTDLSVVTTFIHVRYLDVSFNYLTDITPLGALSHLLWVKGDNNRLQTFSDKPIYQLRYLQWLNLAKNRLCNVAGLGGPALESLNLNENRIENLLDLDSQKLSSLVTLELRGNGLESLQGLCLPNLRHLYLAQNNIRTLEGLEKLELLVTLHLRDNQLETLDALSPEMKCLQHLNLRGNYMSSFKALQALVNVKDSLKKLVLSDNPLTNTEDHRPYVISKLPLLEQLDKGAVSEEERADAKEMKFEEAEEEATDTQ